MSVCVWNKKKLSFLDRANSCNESSRQREGGVFHKRHDRHKHSKYQKLEPRLIISLSIYVVGICCVIMYYLQFVCILKGICTTLLEGNVCVCVCGRRGSVLLHLKNVNIVYLLYIFV